jgi:AAA15 family ATPase/GTPase
MHLIKAIQIHRFRSISDTSIKVGEITIFSGINNSGKSNVLRALNLFFNGESSFGQKYDFEKDYNKAFTGTVGGKRETKITLYFNGQGEAALKSPFSISKTFELGRGVETEYQSDNPIVQKSIQEKDGNITRQFTRFLNKLEYFYIPAVRDRNFVGSLFLHFEKLIEHDSGDDFKDKMDELSDVLKKNSQDISDDFERFIGLPTQAKLSSKITDILGTVEVNVKTGIKARRRTNAGITLEDVYVNLFSSGDGILMSYLAYFLAHVSKKISNKLFIWGFEEPENSLEYSKVQKIAEDILNEFKLSAQIFITTHSPAFAKLKNESGVAFFRVYINPNDSKQASIIKTLSELQTMQQSLFDEGRIDTPEYKKLKEELHFAEFANEIEEALKRINDEAILKSQPLKIFICEDSAEESIKLWDKWLSLFDIKDIKVMTSEGSTKNLVENGIRHQQKLNSGYNPKVFRQLDRDGLTDEQIKVIDEEIFNKEGGFTYKSLYLSVHEIENFAVLINQTLFADQFWTINEHLIVDSFERTATEKASYFDKRFDYKKKEFRDSGNYTLVMQRMRTAARVDWRRFFPGKEICRKVTNFSPIKYLYEQDKEILPKELINYMEEIKKFFDS